ncbi:acyltransferase family protein [Bacillus sp. Bva_UNVM-123]|uniref:acyltransferase family protein n=1 Tax=Bacillus sp. Bva_UNVM-123 TaxID=2829798 RepID=UPI00391F5945
MKKRDFYFDNAKFILIFLVVFGHLLRSFIEENEVVLTLYKVIYTFHMPAFILISGYFAKGIFKKGYIPKIAKKLILPYLIFQFFYSVYYYFLYNKDAVKVDPLDPNWSLWFLLSLFFWNLLLLLFAKYKAAFSISTALFIGLFVGYVDWINNYLSLSRTFVFFPLFLIGYYMKKEHFYSLIKPHVKIVSLLIITSLFIGFYIQPDINYEWLLGSKPYSELDVSPLIAIFTRFGFYLLSLMMVLCFFSIVPRKQYFFTSLGKNTLYVYLLHGFFIRFFRASEAPSFFSDPDSFLLLACLSLLLTILLSSKIITSFAQPLIELKINKLKGMNVRLRTILHFYRKKRLN